MLCLTTWLLNKIILDFSNFGTSFYLAIDGKNYMFYAIMLCKDVSFNRAFFFASYWKLYGYHFFIDSCYPCRQWSLEGSLQENTSFAMF